MDRKPWKKSVVLTILAVALLSFSLVSAQVEIGDASVVRTLPEKAVINEPFNVTLDVKTGGADYYLIEENVPAGLEIIKYPDCGDDGKDNRITCVVMFAEDTEYTYTVKASEYGTYAFAGEYAMDDGKITNITGDTELSVKPVYKPVITDLENGKIITLNLSESKTLLESDTRIEVTNYRGSCKIEYGTYENVTTEELEYYKCNCKNETIKGDMYKGATYEKCDTCNRTVENTKEIMKPLPSAPTDKAVYYEKFLGCDGFDWGCSCWTDPYIAGQKIEGATWWNENYDSCRNITIDHTKVNGSLTDFPALIILDNSTGNFSSKTSNWYDFRFVNDSCNNVGSLLDYEMENYTVDNWTGWVEIDHLDNITDRTISVYYGFQQASDGSNAIGVWDSYYKGVWHFSSASFLYDSTSNSYDLDNIGGVSQLGGIIDGATNEFNGASQYLQNSSGPVLPAGSSVTVEMWHDLDSADMLEGSVTFSIGSQDAPNRCLIHAPWSYLDQTIYWDYGDYASGGRVSGSFSGYMDKWTHIVLVYDNSSYLHGIYLDGILKYSSTNSNDPISQLTGLVISYWGGYLTRAALDEFRVSTVARSTDWIKTEYNNQYSPLTFYTIGSEESQGELSEYVDYAYSGTSPSDINSGMASYSKSYISSSSASDQAPGYPAYSRPVTDGATSTDSPFYSQAYSRYGLSSLSLSDSILRLIAFSVSPLSSLSLADAVLGLSELFRLGLSSSAPLDSVSGLGAYMSHVYTNSGVSDSFLAFSAFLRLPIDSLLIADSLIAGASYDRPLYDSLAVQDAINGLSAFLRTSIEQSIISDSVIRLAEYIRYSWDSSLISDILTHSVAAPGNFFAYVYSSVSSSDTAYSVGEFLRTASSSTSSLSSAATDWLGSIISGITGGGAAIAAIIAQVYPWVPLVPVVLIFTPLMVMSTVPFFWGGLLSKKKPRKRANWMVRSLVALSAIGASYTIAFFLIPLWLPLLAISSLSLVYLKYVSMRRKPAPLHYMISIGSVSVALFLTSVMTSSYEIALATIPAWLPLIAVSSFSILWLRYIGMRRNIAPVYHMISVVIIAIALLFTYAYAMHLQIIFPDIPGMIVRAGL